jgi:cytochrome c biogenesis protein CcmG, thiol:disulfide interchange protein DsbE
MDFRRIGFSVAVSAPLIGLLAFGMTRDPRELPSTMIGRSAPGFELLVMESQGEPNGPRLARLSEHRGEVVILNFWASWCLSCRSEHAALQRVARRYADESVQFYGALYSDNARNAARYIREMGGQSYPTLLDPGSRTAIDYGVYGVPETYFITPDGVIAHKQIGPVTDAILIEWIDRLRTPSLVEAR